MLTQITNYSSQASAIFRRPGQHDCTNFWGCHIAQIIQVVHCSVAVADHGGTVGLDAAPRKPYNAQRANKQSARQPSSDLNPGQGRGLRRKSPAIRNGCRSRERLDRLRLPPPKGLGLRHALRPSESAARSRKARLRVELSFRV